MVDFGSCLQQSLDGLGVSIPSSYPQRNTAILYVSMRDKRTVIASEDHCYRIDRERERERETERERERVGVVREKGREKGSGCGQLK